MIISTCQKFEIKLLLFGKNTQFVPGHSNAWHRAIFDEFGPINNKVISEDIVIPFRAALLGNIKSIDEPLVKRRYHKTNICKTIASKLDFRRKIEWYKKHSILNIKNRKGILESFLKDIQIIQERKPEVNNNIEILKEYLKDYLEDQKLELMFASANYI